MRFIGDTHTKFEEYRAIKNEVDKSIQVGDFGFGFRDVPEDIFRETDRFILGNHDDPHLGRQNPAHLESGHEWEGVFAFNGAASSDRCSRIENVDWWAAEEHTYDEFNSILDKWEVSSCDVVVSHDCPQEIYPLISSHHRYDEASKTRQALSSLIYIRKPKIFIFGHHHKSFDEVYEDIRFICLPELKFIDIDM